MSINSFLFETITKGKSQYKINQFEYNVLVETLKNHRLVDSFLYVFPDFIMPNNSEENSKSSSPSKLYELSKVVEILNDSQTDYLVLKGLALKKYYPKNLPRQSVDFDFIIKDLSQFLKIYFNLKNQGYELDDFPIFTCEKNEVLGVVSLKKEIPNEYPIYIEFNIGGFLISEGTWLNDEELWNKKEKIIWQSIELNVPNDNWNLINLIAEFGGNKSVRIRDAVDYYFLIKNNSNIDLVYINKYIKKWNLRYQYKKLTKFHDLLEDGKYRENRQDSLLHSFNMNLRHILPLTIKKMKRKSIKKLIYHYLKITGNYLVKKDRHLGLIRNIEKSILPVKKVYEAGVHVNFIELDIERNNWKLVPYKGGSVMQTPIGNFLLSNFCLHHEEDFEIALKTISASD